jgi:hypothetical protein
MQHLHLLHALKPPFPLTPDPPPNPFFSPLPRKCFLPHLAALLVVGLLGIDDRLAARSARATVHQHAVLHLCDA